VRELHDDYKGDVKHFKLVEGYHHTSRLDKDVGEITNFLTSLSQEFTVKSFTYGIETERATISVDPSKFSRSMEEGVSPNKPKRSNIKEIEKIKTQKFALREYQGFGPNLGNVTKQSFLGSVKEDQMESMVNLSFDHVYSNLSISKMSTTRKDLNIKDVERIHGRENVLGHKFNRATRLRSHIENDEPVANMLSLKK
jgi:hypothetical protein